MKYNFEERKQKRIENAKKQAEKNNRLSDQYYNAANEIAAFIPPGQPILVGHHSEKRHRSDLKKIDGKMRKSIESANKAKYNEEKAESIENNNAISSDDPEAILKLTERLAQLERLQIFMKAANQCVRKQDKTSFLQLELSDEMLWEKLNAPGRFGGPGLASFKLTNNNAKINRLKKRITQLEKMASRKEQSILFEGGKIKENKEANRIQFLFNSKPDKAIRVMLRKEGFIYSGLENAWQRQLNYAGIYAAKRALQKLKEIQSQQ